MHYIWLLIRHVFAYQVITVFESKVFRILRIRGVMYDFTLLWNVRVKIIRSMSKCQKFSHFDEPQSRSVSREQMSISTPFKVEPFSVLRPPFDQSAAFLAELSGHYVNCSPYQRGFFAVSPDSWFVALYCSGVVGIRVSSWTSTNKCNGWYNCKILCTNARVRV